METPTDEEAGQNPIKADIVQRHARFCYQLGCRRGFVSPIVPIDEDDDNQDERFPLAFEPEETVFSVDTKRFISME